MMKINILKKLAFKALKFASPMMFAKTIGVKFGKDCRFIDVDFGSEPWLIELGDRVSATNVSFVTHDGAVWVLRPEFPDIDMILPIKIGSNVFIGLGSIILPGTSIGDNCIIGAGSVVRGSVPENTVYAGVPAKKIYGIEEYKQKIWNNCYMIKGYGLRKKKKFLTEKFME